MCNSYIQLVVSVFDNAAMFTPWQKILLDVLEYKFLESRATFFSLLKHPVSLVPRTLGDRNANFFLNITHENMLKYLEKCLAHRRCKINAISLPY